MTAPLAELVRTASAAAPRATLSGKITAIAGNSVEASIRGAAIGDFVSIGRRQGEGSITGQILGSRADRASITLFGTSAGISVGASVICHTKQPGMLAGPHLLGQALNAHGAVLKRFAELPRGSLASAALQWRFSAGYAPSPLERLPFRSSLHTGIRAIDALLPLAHGQRVAILAEPGVGKSTLLAQLADSSSVSVTVVALIGERGREISECIERTASSEAASSTVVVASTSDDPPALRVAAASQALTLAEYFRDLGHHVLFQCDSLTRYIRAVRELALAAGELPVRRGYPASVFTALPPFFERAGRTANGSISAMYTMLLTSDLEEDPMVEEVKGVIDGHLTLSAALAQRGYFPALAPLQSLSRAEQAIAPPQHMQQARVVRRALKAIETAEEARLLGGELSPEENHAVAQTGEIEQFLRQDSQTWVKPDEMSAQLARLAGLLTLSGRGSDAQFTDSQLAYSEPSYSQLSYSQLSYSHPPDAQPKAGAQPNSAQRRESRDYEVAV